ncbi:MAG TPA: ATP synthase F1 subunit delta [Roseiflexaceae bacterium]|nr:ATP synthase F1 subunit delta [Roseiflexaceae bacterium]
MSTSEAQVIARALYDALVGQALQALRAAARSVDGASGELTQERLAALLPAETPREVRNLLTALAAEKRLGSLPAVVQAFEQYAQAGAARPIEGEVVSAIELSEAQRARITSELKGRYGERLELRFSVDPTLIGGLIIRVGDQVLDNSLRTRLSAVQRNMLAS